MTVGAFEAKNNLSRLLKQVAAGERITITNRGVPVATMIPATIGGELDREVAIERLRTFAKGRKTSLVEIRQMMEEGRKG